MDKKELQNRTKQFALRIIKLVNNLPSTSTARAIGHQLIRSGTSVGANYRSALRSRSKAEFISKLGIVIEENDETIFWLELLIEGKIVKRELLGSLLKEANEILAIMISTKKSAHKNLKSEILNLKSSGFTIMEVIVSISIIALGLIGVLSLVQQNIRAQYINKNNLIASQLAQEGLELVRGKRDENWLALGNNWLIGSGAESDSDILQDGSYIIDYSGNIEGSINSVAEAGAALYLSSAGFYSHDSSGAATPFSRIILATQDSTSSSTISCLVQWKEKNNTLNYKAETNLYDWR